MADIRDLVRDDGVLRIDGGLNPSSRTPGQPRRSFHADIARHFYAAAVFSGRESLAAYSRGTRRGARRNSRRVLPRSPWGA
jgi:hypothetical protein